MAESRRDAEHRRAAREARKSLLKIDPRKIRWGSIDREAIPPGDLAEAREAMLLGLEVWAPNVAYDGSDYWLIDGAETLALALALGVRSIPVQVHMGSRDDVAGQAGRNARFRAENLDDPDFLAAQGCFQRVVIRVPSKRRRMGEVESFPTAAEDSPSQQFEALPEPGESIPAELPTISFSEQLRTIIRDDGRTIYAIETAAGVPRGGVGRFLSGERGLTTDTLDRLAVVLGLRVVGPGEDG